MSYFEVTGTGFLVTSPMGFKARIGSALCPCVSYNFEFTEQLKQ